VTSVCAIVIVMILPAASTQHKAAASGSNTAGVLKIISSANCRSLNNSSAARGAISDQHLFAAGGFFVSQLVVKSKIKAFNAL
jgi:hypothetical protein